jgi:periplasmic protein TonB
VVQAGAIRVERGAVAAAVVLAHLIVLWLAIELRFHPTEEPGGTAQPVLARIIELPRHAPLAPIPIEVKVERVQHLQNIAPRIPDIPDVPQEPIPEVESVPVTPPVASVATEAPTGEGGNNSASSGPRGSGRELLILQRTVPKYPLESARKGEQGSTVVQLRVTERGRVDQVKVTRGSGFKRLDDAALDAIRKWRFQASPRGAAPNGTWAEMELRFVLYKFTYSRLGELAVRDAYEERVRSGATDAPVPGSDAALKRFIADVQSREITGTADTETHVALIKMRDALKEWGEVKNVLFTGTAGSGWNRYEVKPAFRAGAPSVEVRWAMFEVEHQHATSEWLIAIDRQGMVWVAQAGPAPPR